MFCRKTLIQELSREEAKRQPSAAEWLADQDARARAMSSPAERPLAGSGSEGSGATALAQTLPPL
jgi:hypothetical protein